MKNPLFAVAALALLQCFSDSALGIDCVWLVDPASNNWNTATNWSSDTVPGYQDSVFFAQSNQRQVSITSSSLAYNFTFEADASPYEIDAEATGYIYIGLGNNGLVTGIQNFSGVMQNFVAKSDSAGGGGYFFIYGNADVLSTFTTEPVRTLGGYAGNVWFQVDQSQFGRTTAGSCIYVNNGGIIAGGGGGVLSFHDGASGDNATIVNQAATVVGASGGLTTFENNSGTEFANITSEGAVIAGAGGGITQINGSSHAGGATLVAQGGSNGGDGGTIRFEGSSDGSRSRIEVFGNGNLDVSIDILTIGSLEGDGLVLLQNHQLRIGDNNLSTTFSGSIDAGSVVKLGTGTFTLEGVSTYAGGTFVTAGALVANSNTGSATGTGAVNINAGTLGGQGRVLGPVTIGTGNGPGAVLEPSFVSKRAARLRISYPLTFKADGTYICKIRTKGAAGDEVRANDVTIESGAQFTLVQISNKKLTDGTVFTVIDNISFHPINGSFSNLIDGSVLTAGQNKFLVNYSGGDGNDLTLTVVP